MQCNHLARNLAKLWEVCGSWAPAAPVWVERKEIVSFVPRSEVLRQDGPILESFLEEVRLALSLEDGKVRK